MKQKQGDAHAHECIYLCIYTCNYMPLNIYRTFLYYFVVVVVDIVEIFVHSLYRNTSNFNADLYLLNILNILYISVSLKKDICD